MVPAPATSGSGPLRYRVVVVVISIEPGRAEACQGGPRARRHGHFDGEPCACVCYAVVTHSQSVSKVLSAAAAGGYTIFGLTGLLVVSESEYRVRQTV